MSKVKKKTAPRATVKKITKVSSKKKAAPSLPPSTLATSEEADESESESFIPEILEESDIKLLDKPDEIPLLISKKHATADQSKALVTSDPVALYLAKIREYPVLSREKEHELAVRYKETGDPLVAEALVTSNLRFVVKIAAEYSKFGAKMIDLIQEGNIGLMHAVKEFNPYKGVRLITYAVWWIRGYIQEYLMRQYSLVRIGTTQSQRKLFYKLQKEKELLEAAGNEPTTALLSTRLGVSEDEIKNMNQRLSGRDVSLNATLDDESTTSLLDLQFNKNDIPLDELLGGREELSILREKIDELIPSLNEKEIFILQNRILSENPMNLQEIGDHYGTTREAVRQMEARIIKKIKELFEKALN